MRKKNLKSEEMWKETKNIINYQGKSAVYNKDEKNV